MVADFRQAQAASPGRLGTNGADPEAQLVCFGLPSRKITTPRTEQWTAIGVRRTLTNGMDKDLSLKPYPSIVPRCWCAGQRDKAFAARSTCTSIQFPVGVRTLRSVLPCWPSKNRKEVAGTSELGFRGMTGRGPGSTLEVRR